MIDKLELKQNVLHSVGVQVDDMLEAAQKERAGHGGAKIALAQLAKNIEGLAKVADDEMDKGELPQDLEVLGHIKRFITRAAMMTATAAQHQENMELASNGKIVAYEQVIKSIKKKVDASSQQIAEVKLAIASGSVVAEDDGSLSQVQGSAVAPGVRPGMSIAQQRRLEDARERAQQEQPAEESKEAPPKEQQTSPEEAAPVAEKAVKKKATKAKASTRRRRKKTNGVNADASNAG
jgi:hypothetical protein